MVVSSSAVVGKVCVLPVAGSSVVGRRLVGLVETACVLTLVVGWNDRLVEEGRVVAVVESATVEKKVVSARVLASSCVGSTVLGVCVFCVVDDKVDVCSVVSSVLVSCDVLD